MATTEDQTALTDGRAQPGAPVDQTTPRRVIAVIDGNSLLHRAFHAIPPTMTAPDGRPTNALFGFVSMFLKLVDTFHPYGVVCAFDKGKPRRRMELLPQYKAQRPPTDPTLAQQFPMIHDLMRAMGVPVMEAEGWEGDDILGTLGRQGEALGCDMLLVSGDRDVYQLATEHVRVVNTKKGLSDVVVFDPAGVAELYDGIVPARVPDFYGLKGDTSDNIPGVPGIGPKKASALIVQYGSLDEVLAHADEIKGKMGESIRAHREDALVSRRIATIETTAPVQLDVAAAAWPGFDADVLRAAFDGLGFTRLAERVLAARDGGDAAGATGASGGAAAPVEATPALPDDVVEGEQAMAALVEAVDAGAWLGVVVDEGAAGGTQETLFGTDEALYVAIGSGWVVDDVGAGVGDDGRQTPRPSRGHRADEPARVLRFTGDDVDRALALAYTRGRVVTCAAKEDLHRLVPVDSALPARVCLRDVVPARVFDVDVAAYLLDSNRSDYAPAAILASHLPFAVPSLPEPPKARRGAKAKAGEAQAQGEVAYEELRERSLVATAAALPALREVLRGRMEDDGAARCFDEIEMPLVPALVELERAGMTVSRERLGELSGELEGRISDLEARIYEEAGEEFNIDSPVQLSHVLFDEDKKVRIPVRKGMKRTKTGFISTNAKMLADLALEYPIVQDVLTYREYAKIKATYLDALPREADKYDDRRVHTTYNQTITATGRLSSSDPNLQNIPIRTELGRMVRTAFVPSGDDACILGCDYSQIELRLLAHLSGDEGLIAAFTQGEDFHRETAAMVFGVDPADVTPQMRSRAKAVNFGIVYGQQAYGLSTSLGIPFGEAQEMIDQYFRQFPQVRAYLDGLVDFAHAHGYVETMFGRRRHVPDVFSRNPTLRAFGERTAMNHPMQGTAADIIKIAMARVQRRLDAEGFRARMIVQVHDELDFDCPRDEAKALGEMVREEMSGVVSLRVPLVVSCEVGDTWADAH